MHFGYACGSLRLDPPVDADAFVLVVVGPSCATAALGEPPHPAARRERPIAAAAAATAAPGPLTLLARFAISSPSQIPWVLIRGRAVRLSPLYETGGCVTVTRQATHTRAL
jgi:hypothetical protein